MPDTQAITLSKHISAPVERVWAALTTPAGLASWWAPGDIRPEVGHRFTLDMGNFGIQQCEVLAAAPQELISYTFGEGSLNTTITWRLTNHGGETHVDFEHAGFDTTTDMGKMAFGGMSGGWPMILGKLELTLR